MSIKEIDTSKEILPISGIETIVFDMDGTLYQLDGEKNGFTNSTLDKTILLNITTFLMEQEGISTDEAQVLFNNLKPTIKSFSQYFAKKYGITRTDYFNHVWNINPENIVQNYEIPIFVLRELSQKGKNLLLLTHAPQVWQERVIEFLGLDGIFAETFTADSFLNKEEIYQQLVEKHQPSSLLAVGDQFETDIEPALNLGIQSIHVKSPQDLIKILELIK